MASSVQSDSYEKTDTPPTPAFSEISRLMVVAIDTTQGSKLVWKVQTAPNGPWGSAWTPINEDAYVLVEGGSTRDGRVAVVALTADKSAMHYIVEAPDTSQQENWEAPFSLGTPPSANPIRFFKMAGDADGRIEIFAVEENLGALWWIYQNPDQIIETKVPVEIDGKTVEVTVQEKAPPQTPWSQWQQLDLPAGYAMNYLDVVNTADGRISVFGYASSSAPLAVIYQSEQSKLVALAPADWTAWQPLTSQATGQVYNFSAQLDKAGAINLLGFFESNVVRIKETPPDSNVYGPWTTRTVNSGGRPVLNLTTGTDGDGHLTAIAVDENGIFYACQQIDVLAEQWQNWHQINTGDLGPLQLAYNSDGRLTLFATSGLSPQRLRCISQSAMDSTEWELVWTELAADGISQYTVVRDLTPTGNACTFIAMEHSSFDSGSSVRVAAR